MSRIIRRTAGMKKEVGAALIVALQMITLTLISLISFVGGPQQSAKAPADSQMSAASQAQPVSAPPAGAIRATKLYEPRATQIFELATTRAESARQSAQQSVQASSGPNEASLTTDREDYPPYSYVYMSGTGFEPGETVNMIVVQSAPNPTAYEPWDVVADENGNINTSWYISSEELIGATMQVTATGQTSGLTASATFTDAINVTFFQDAGRTISRDAFTWGSTVFARLSGQQNNRCYKIDWVDPSDSVVQSTNFSPTTGNDDDLYNLPPSGSSGVWTVKVYEGPNTGACTFTVPVRTWTFDVARAVIIGALADNYVDLKNPTTIQNAAGTTLIVSRNTQSGNDAENRAFLRFDLSGISGTINSAKLRMSISA